MTSRIARARPRSLSDLDLRDPAIGLGFLLLGLLVIAACGTLVALVISLLGPDAAVELAPFRWETVPPPGWT